MALASGMLLVSGKHTVVDLISSGIVALGGLYVGLITHASGVVTDQIGSGVTELSSVSCLGYNRLISATWTKTGDNNPKLTGSQVDFYCSGDWNDVAGYFVSLSETGNDAMWVQYYPRHERGVVPSGYTHSLIPSYEQQDKFE